jgi:hypothetical protein
MKRTGRDEPIGGDMNMCMETIQGISLYSYLYLKLAKTLFLCLSFIFSLLQYQNRKVRIVLQWVGRLAPVGGGR